MNYRTLSQYGSQIELDCTVNANELVDWSKNFEFVQYNPRKEGVNRYGLSITSLGGDLSGVPDLDSLYEYNKIHGTTYKEKHFITPTEVMNDTIKNLLDPWKGHYYRTHYLKFGPGGFFPPHRDWNYVDGESDIFRLILPLQNVNPPSFNFMLEDKALHWEPGRLYFLDTVKMHYLFNSSFTDSYWIVVNVQVNDETIRATLERLNQK